MMDETKKPLGQLLFEHFFSFMVGVLFVLLMHAIRDYGAVYEVRQGDTTWRTHRMPEFDADSNWRFRDINCGCEIIIGGGYSIKRVK